MGSGTSPYIGSRGFALATRDIAFAIMSEAPFRSIGFGMPSTQPSLGKLIRIGDWLRDMPRLR